MAPLLWMQNFTWFVQDTGGYGFEFEISYTVIFRCFFSISSTSYENTLNSNLLLTAKIIATRISVDFSSKPSRNTKYPLTGSSTTKSGGYLIRTLQNPDSTKSGGHNTQRLQRALYLAGGLTNMGLCPLDPAIFLSTIHPIDSWNWFFG